MKINIKHIAKLANLTLTTEEETKFAKQLEATLETVNELNQVNTDDIEITSQVTGLENVLEQDVAKPSLSQKEALSNSKNTQSGFFVVSEILEE